MEQMLYSRIDAYIKRNSIDQTPMKLFMNMSFAQSVKDSSLTEENSEIEIPEFLRKDSKATERKKDKKVELNESQVQESFRERKLDDILQQVEETFAVSLLRLIDQKKMKDVEVYKRAGIDRKLFSKIRSNENYMPSKQTAIALAIGLKLNLDETKDLLGKAGYALSHCNKSDLIVEFFIHEGRYNMIELNEALLAFDQPLIGRTTR